MGPKLSFFERCHWSLCGSVGTIQVDFSYANSLSAQYVLRKMGSRQTPVYVATAADSGFTEAFLGI